MKIHKLLLLSFVVAAAASAQDQPNAMREQPNQPKASAPLKLRPASSARTATGMQDSPQQDAQARRERAEKVAAGLQKKTNDTANAAASNVK